MNSVNSETAEELLKAFKEFEEDKQSLVAIFASKNGVFCSGFDLAEAG